MALEEEFLAWKATSVGANGHQLVLVAAESDSLLLQAGGAIALRIYAPDGSLFVEADDAAGPARNVEPLENALVELNTDSAERRLTFSDFSDRLAELVARTSNADVAMAMSEEDTGDEDSAGESTGQTVDLDVEAGIAASEWCARFCIPVECGALVEKRLMALAADGSNAWAGLDDLASKATVELQMLASAEEAAQPREGHTFFPKEAQRQASAVAKGLFIQPACPSSSTVNGSEDDGGSAGHVSPPPRGACAIDSDEGIGALCMAVAPSWISHDADILGQLGLALDVQVTFVFILPDPPVSSLALPTSTFVVAQRTRQSSYACKHIIPRCFDEFKTRCRGRRDPSSPSFPVEFLLVLREFVHVAPQRCLSCFVPLPGASAFKLGPCDDDLCVFHCEEYCCSVLQAVKADVKAARLHVALALAAVRSKNPICVEPFPPHFLRERQVRRRAGVFDDARLLAQNKEDLARDANKDLDLMDAALSCLPDVGELATLSCEADVVRCLQQEQRRAGVAPHDAVLAYRCLRFVFATLRLMMVPVSVESTLASRLPLPEHVAQYAVLSNGHGEERFQKKARMHGSGFALHGSPLHSWYSILRNGLRNLSNTGLMANGAALGEGVYLAEDSSTSTFYCKGLTSSGYHAVPGSMQIMAVVEYAKDGPASQAHARFGRSLLQRPQILTAAEDSVVLRYILVAEGKPFSAFNVAELDVGQRFSSVSPVVPAMPSFKLDFISEARLSARWRHRRRQLVAGEAVAVPATS